MWRNTWIFKEHWPNELAATASHQPRVSPATVVAVSLHWDVNTATERSIAGHLVLPPTSQPAAAAQIYGPLALLPAAIARYMKSPKFGWVYKAWRPHCTSLQYFNSSATTYIAHKDIIP